MEENNDQLVTIDIPQESIQPQTETTNTSEILKSEVVAPPSASVLEQSETKPQIERNGKGQIVKGVAQDTNKNGTAGRPCKYCQDKEKYQKLVETYMKQINEAAKPAIPWIEELALILDIDDETLTNWANKKDENDVFEHPELYAIFRKLKTTQKFRLKQRAIGRFNPHGALYLLNADHKVVQTDRKIVTGEDNGPLRIEFVDEKPIPGEPSE